VVLDSFGSAGLDKADIISLRKNGAEVFFFSHFLHRIHRKILVVDEKVAFLGGVNFHQVSRRWNDLMVEVREGKLVSSIVKSFAKVYAECGGKDLAILTQNKRLILDKTHTWLIEHFPVKNKASLKKIYKQNLRKAEKKITLATPYFMPSHWLVGSLHQAVLHGVKVEVLVPRTTNHFWVNRVNYFFMFKLSRLGVDFYLEPKMNHAKAMIIDNQEGIMGSHNLDFLSFEINSEVGIFFKEKEAVEKLVQIMEGWKKDSILFNASNYKPKALDYILSPILRLFLKIF
jgi:cardiolipin synthase